MSPWIEWLVEVVHYPFDTVFDRPPPVELIDLAEGWAMYENDPDLTVDDWFRAIMFEINGRHDNVVELPTVKGE